MRRRTLLLAAPALVAVPFATAAPPEASIRTLGAARRWLERVESSNNLRTTGAWPISTVLQHLAQSIEMSMDGYPQPRSALFQHTVGSGAFAFFKWRGRMSHSLSEPIPGAPPLIASAERAAAIARLRAAIARFEGYGGELRPHFAYGALDKSDYALAHSLHIGNHQEEIVL